MLDTYPLPPGQLRHLPKADLHFIIATDDDNGWHEKSYRRAGHMVRLEVA